MTSPTPGEAFGLPRHADPAQPIDETPEVDEHTFDLGAWIGGVKSTVRAVTLYQRADLLAEIDDLERRLTLARKTAGQGGAPEGEDALGDDTDEVTSLTRQLEQALLAFTGSAVVFRVQGRSDEWRDAAKKRLKKQGITDETEVVLRSLADSIISPAGVTYEHLAHLNEVSQPQVKMLLTAWAMANHQPEIGRAHV